MAPCASPRRWRPPSPVLWIEIADVIRPGILGWWRHGSAGSWIGEPSPRVQVARGERRRDGAYAWGVMFDMAHPEHVMEWFLLGSWEEHLRQHERVSQADREEQQERREERRQHQRHQLRVALARDRERRTDRLQPRAAGPRRRRFLQ